jgi:L-threonylcarbamoyladenylate synthase
VCSADPHALLTVEPAVAVDALLAGRLAVLPTETVYGLGADAGHPHAVGRVFAVKGRPADHPLIVHLGSVDQLGTWVTRVPAYAERLAAACWPGPLTLVLPRSERASDLVTGGQATVAVRVPDHPLTVQVLREIDRGIAAPSANRFGRVSPTTAEHVLAELGDALLPGSDVVLDGGPCRVGVESTIVDCTGPAPRVLRPGAVDAATIMAVGGVAVSEGASSVRAPGTLPSHYAPHARVRLATAEDLTQLPWQSPTSDPQIGVLALDVVPTPPGTVRLSAPSSATGYAHVLYAALREADALDLPTVLAVPPEGSGIAEAVRDRLTRAAVG